MSYRQHVFLSQARQRQARVRLFCFPYAGGGASVYYSWPEEMPPEIEVCTVQLPGRENRFAEPPLTNATALIETLVPAIKPYLDMPYAFFGHSMGALISFELAHALRKEGVSSPQYLFVSGHRAPHLPRHSPLLYDLPDAEFVQELRKLNGTPEEVLQSKELFSLLLPVLRADFELCETYRYQHRERLSCPIVALSGLNDKDVSREMVEAWGEHTTGAFCRRFFSGDHFFLHKHHSYIVHFIAQRLLDSDAACRQCTLLRRAAS
jgi:surfactin synthase thioesterase subunit